jgi:hypothetical protein
MMADSLKRMLLASLVLVVPAAGYAQEATFTRAVTDSIDAGAVLPRATVSGTNTFALLSGIAAHDLYHAGQIQLLKRLQRS